MTTLQLCPFLVQSKLSNQVPQHGSACKSSTTSPVSLVACLLAAIYCLYATTFHIFRSPSPRGSYPPSKCAVEEVRQLRVVYVGNATAPERRSQAVFVESGSPVVRQILCPRRQIALGIASSTVDAPRIRGSHRVLCSVASSVTDSRSSIGWCDRVELWATHV
jgi:hypothetical protein